MFHNKLRQNLGLATLLLLAFITGIVGIQPVFKSEITKEEILRLAGDIEDNIIPNLLSSVGNQNSGIFLYYNNYKSRLILSANTEIFNPDINIQEDSFFYHSYLLHKEGVCNVTITDYLAEDTSLYKVLNIKGQISENHYYVSCPMFRDDVLIGYLSSVYYSERPGFIVTVYLDTKAAAKIIQRELIKVL